MATKQFAIPLDDSSNESGDITFKALKVAGAQADFALSNVGSPGTSDQLNLKTKKGGTATNHIFSVTVSSGKAGVTLSASNLTTIYNDANGGDWDYVEADWSLGAVDTPAKSVMTMIQNGHTYDYVGWPPNG